MSFSRIIVVSLLLAIMTAQVSLAADGWAPWETYTGVTGVGDVSKSSPAEDALHYGGNGAAEKARFAIDVSGAVDNDRRRCYFNDVVVDTQISNAGLNEQQTNWECTSGWIRDGKFTTTYTPGNTPKSGIIIKATVYDGLAFNSNDAGVTKQYANSINVFRVGVHLTTSPGGGDYTKWEDGQAAGQQPTESLSTFTQAAGNNTNQDNDTADATWTLITEPSGCDIRGNIKGSAISSATGAHTLFATDDDLVDSGSGTLSVGVSAKIISFGYSWDLADDTMAIISSGIGYGSDYGVIYEETGLTNVSADPALPNASRPINAAPGSGQWTGKAGVQREGKWKTEVKCTAKSAVGESCLGRGSASATATFDIPNAPSYQSF